MDEAARTVSLLLDVDLGAYSMALGSVQKLTNGNYHFDLGWMPNGFSHALEHDPNGQLVSQIETETQQYTGDSVCATCTRRNKCGNRIFFDRVPDNIDVSPSKQV